MSGFVISVVVHGGAETAFVSFAVHGDHVLLTPSREGNGGGLVMLGRSDGVL